jgi:PAX-interacting protein 1
MYHALLEELREINIRLIDTKLTLNEDDADMTAKAGESILVKCTYNAIALSPGLEAHFTSSQLVRLAFLFLFCFLKSTGGDNS